MNKRRREILDAFTPVVAFAREQVAAAPGTAFCSRHGARNLLAAFERIKDANVFYMNLPYGEAGAYVWI